MSVRQHRAEGPVRSDRPKTHGSGDAKMDACPPWTEVRSADRARGGGTSANFRWRTAFSVSSSTIRSSLACKQGSKEDNCQRQ